MAISEAATEPHSAIFKLGNAQPCPDADLQPLAGGLKIVTPATPGSVAARIPSDAALVAALADRTPVIMVRIVARVLSGKVGIGCVATDGSTCLWEAELEAATAGNQPEPLAFLIEATELGSFVIQNADPRGEASSIVLESVETSLPDEGSTRGISVSLEEAKRSGGAQLVSGDDGLSIVTPAATWSYAVQVPVRRSDPPDKKAARSLAIVTATIVVRSGRIGLGALSSDGSTFLDETEVDGASNGGAPVQVTLLVDDLDSLASVVVRNRQPHNQPSSAVLRSVNVSIVDNSAVICAKGIFALPPKLRPVRDWPQYYGSRADTIMEKLRVRAYRALSVPLAIRWLDSLRVWLYPGNQTSHALAASGLYEPGMLLTLKEFLPSGGVFIDVGANVGLLSLFAAWVVGQNGAVHAFEPSPREYVRLRENVALNRFEGIIHAYPCALGASPERRTLHIAEDMYSGMNTFGDRFYSSGVATRDLTVVAVQTLDRHVAETGLRRLDLMKVDTEGFEMFVLQGGREALSRWHPTLLLEISPALLASSGSSVEEIGALLRAEGYRFYALDEGTGERWTIETLVNAPTSNVLAVHSEGQA